MLELEIPQPMQAIIIGLVKKEGRLGQ